MIEELKLPAMLIEIGDDAFSNCIYLHVVYVEHDCQIDVKAHVAASVVVIRIPDKHVLVGAQLLSDLWVLREVEIPDGVQAICDNWFASSDIESVRIPASVREICAGAFCGCRKLKTVVFDENSRLEVTGDNSFRGSGLGEI